LEELLCIQHFHLFSLELHRFAHKVDFGVRRSFLRQVHDPKNLVDCQTQNRVAAPSTAPQDHGRVVASIRDATFHQHMKVEHRQRITTILGETYEMGT